MKMFLALKNVLFSIWVMLQAKGHLNIDFYFPNSSMKKGSCDITLFSLQINLIFKDKHHPNSGPVDNRGIVPKDINPFPTAVHHCTRPALNYYTVPLGNFCIWRPKPHHPLKTCRLSPCLSTSQALLPSKVLITLLISNFLLQIVCSWPVISWYCCLYWFCLIW